MPDDAPPALPPEQSADRDDNLKVVDKVDKAHPSSTTISRPLTGSVFDFLLSIVPYLQILQDFLVSFPTKTVDKILFAGRFGTRHTTKFVFTQINDQYKESIKTLDAAVLWSLAVIIICWSVFFLLPIDKTVTIPYIGFPLSRADWLRISPAIILSMQIFFASTLMRMMVFRYGITRILQAADTAEIKKGEIGDVTNLHLSGFFGTFMIFLHLLSIFKQIKLTVFYWTAISIIVAVLLAPQITLLSIIIWLFINGYYVSAIAYFILTAIIGTAAIVLMLAAIWLYTSSGFLIFSEPRSPTAATGESRESEGQEVAAQPRRRRGRGASERGSLKAMRGSGPAGL